MMPFKKLRNRRVAESNAQMEISNKWKTLKERTALCLQRKSELLSMRAKRHMLIFFCSLFGGGSIGIIIHASTAKEQKILITRISRSAPSIQEEKDYLKPDSAITKMEYDRVEQFKSYLIQLKNDSSHNKFDSIIQLRPHLIDSIYLFEKIYLQQK